MHKPNFYRAYHKGDETIWHVRHEGKEYWADTGDLCLSSDKNGHITFGWSEAGPSLQYDLFDNNPSLEKSLNYWDTYGLLGSPDYSGLYNSYTPKAGYLREGMTPDEWAEYWKGYVDSLTEKGVRHYLLESYILHTNTHLNPCYRAWEHYYGYKSLFTWSYISLRQNIAEVTSELKYKLWNKPLWALKAKLKK